MRLYVDCPVLQIRRQQKPLRTVKSSKILHALSIADLEQTRQTARVPVLSVRTKALHHTGNGFFKAQASGPGKDLR